MAIILILNILLNISACYILFSLCSVTLNIFLERYRSIAVVILDGVIVSTMSLFWLPVYCWLILYFVLFTCSFIVLFYPINLQKIILLELILGAYILLGWGVNYVLQLLFFNIFSITNLSYLCFCCLRGFVFFVLGVTIYCLFKILYRKKEISTFIYDVELFIKDKRVRLNMFLDSGNCLYDENLTGLPIVVVSKNVIEEKLHGRIDDTGFRIVRYSTVGGGGLGMPIFSPDKVVLIDGGRKKEIKAMVGVVNADFKSYDGLFHSALI